MEKVNHPLKARIYIGGLKSLLIDVVGTIEDIEKSGGVPSDFIETLQDVKGAIDLTLNEFKKVVIRCCDHGTAHDKCDDSCDDSIDDEEYCAECDEICDECVCDEEDDEAEEVIPPSKVKKVESKVIIPAKKKGK